MRTLLILSIFLVVFSAFGQNITNETVAVMERWNTAFFNQDLNGVVSTFSYDAYMLANGNFYYGQDQLWSVFNNLFYSLNSSNCTSFGFGAPFYLNQTAHATWSMSCSNYTMQGANTFEVEYGFIKSFITDSVIIPNNNGTSNGSSNGSSNTSNSTNNTWDIAVRQFSAWGQKDVYAILADYASDAFMIRQGNDSRTEVIDGYWNLYWVIQQELYYNNCEQNYWEGPVVKNNVIYLSWFKRCGGRKFKGSDTLVVNQWGLISSVVRSGTELGRRHNRTEFFNEIN